MTDINDIRKRHEHVDNDKGYAWTPCGISAHMDRATLLAKVDELEARIEVANKLPKKWRWRCGNKKTSTNQLRMDDADELEAALELRDNG